MTINCKGKLMDLTIPKVMGIVNVTPDSFYDGGRYNEVDQCLLHVESMLNAGADIIDVGAASSRPGAEILSAEQEWTRLEPALTAIIERFPEAVVSVDTYHATVAEKSIECGVAMINDITGGGPEMYAVIAKHNVPYVMMHSRGNAQTMQQLTEYQNITADIILFFSERLHQLKQMGVIDVVVDPGFGFAKDLEQNYELLNNLGLLKVLDCPILVGVSRKSMLYKPLNTTPDEALSATSAIHAVALQNGAQIIRVHDVKEAKQVVSLNELINQNKS